MKVEKKKSATHKADGERALEKNIEMYKRDHGHKPYCGLTPEGAKALIAFLKEKDKKFDLMDISGGVGDKIYDSGLPIPLLTEFFETILHMKKPDPGFIATMLVPAGAGYWDEMRKIIHINPDALDALAAQSRGRGGRED